MEKVPAEEAPVEEAPAEEAPVEEAPEKATPKRRSKKTVQDDSELAAKENSGKAAAKTAKQGIEAEPSPEAD